MITDLWLGDCLDINTGLPSLPDKSVDHVISDPPFGNRTHSGQRHGRRHANYRAADNWLTNSGLPYAALTPEQVELAGAHFARVARKWILLMTSHDLFPAWEKAVGRYSFAPLPIVLKGMNVRLAGDGPSSWSVWLFVNRPRGLRDGTKPGAYVGSPGHGVNRALNPVKGAKPLWLMESLLTDYTSPGDLICDPFSGGGTTAVAAFKLGRRFIGWEVNSAFRDIAISRLKKTAEDHGRVMAGHNQ